MQFRRSAGIFVTGICFVVGGPLLAIIGSTFGTLTVFVGMSGTPGAAPNPETGMAGFFIILMVVGALLSIIGFFLLIAAVHRALVKIDALPAGAQSANRDNWYSNRR